MLHISPINKLFSAQPQWQLSKKPRLKQDHICETLAVHSALIDYRPTTSALICPDVRSIALRDHQIPAVGHRVKLDRADAVECHNLGLHG